MKKKYKVNLCKAHIFRIQQNGRTHRDRDGKRSQKRDSQVGGKLNFEIWYAWVAIIIIFIEILFLQKFTLAKNAMFLCKLIYLDAIEMEIQTTTK